MSLIKSPITMITGAAVTAKRLVQFSSGEVIHNVATSIPIGVAEFSAKDDTAVAVRTLSEDGTLEMTASDPISLDADVYADAAGKIQALPVTGGSYVKIGIAVEAATADDDIIQVLPYEVSEIVSVVTALTAEAPAATPGAVHTIDSTSNAVDVTLAVDTVIGRQTGFVMTEASNPSTVTVAVHDVEDAEVFDFIAVDEMLVLMWTGTEYITVRASAQSVNELTTAAPAITPGTINNIDSTSNAVDATLADDTIVGRQTKIVMTEASASSTVTIARHDDADGKEYTFDTVDETLIVEWTGTEYMTVAVSASFINALTATTPVIAPGTINTIDSTSNAVDATLADDTVVGRQTKITMIQASNSSTVTVAHHDDDDGKEYTLDAIDETLIVEWTGTEYVTIFASPSTDFTTLTAATPAIIPGSTNLIDSNARAVDATLADDTVVGRHTLMIMTDNSNSSTVAIANHTTSDPESATFDAVGEVLDLMWMGSEYVTIYATATFV